MTTDPIEDDIRRLHAEGHGRNEISRRLGVSRRKVTETAARLSLTFDRTATKTATAARAADSQARRSALAEKLLNLIEDETEALVKLGPADNVADADRRGRAIASISRAVVDVTRTIPTTDGTDDALQQLGIFGEILTRYAQETRTQAPEN